MSKYFDEFYDDSLGRKVGCQLKRFEPFSNNPSSVHECAAKAVALSERKTPHDKQSIWSNARSFCQLLKVQGC
jgi:glycine/serine hydroxymethyltransferase